VDALVVSLHPLLPDAWKMFTCVYMSMYMCVNIYPECGGVCIFCVCGVGG